MAESNKATDDFLTQAAELSRVQDESPQDFLPAAARMRIAKRKAYYFVEIHKAFEGLPVDRERLLGIKWTKAQVLARYVKRETHMSQEILDDLLDKANRLPVHELQEALTGADTDSPKKCVLLYFTPEEHEIFSEVVKSHEVHGTRRSFRYKEQALVRALKKLKT